ncbi:MAG: hypothetical protein MUE44_22270 [Oscillatoriaceae cyanobacterium Prado104]|jgi:hypothetical protein|nr:hypothetical protein [Oscillatoriaceae cyanobacterium Prado104]
MSGLKATVLTVSGIALWLAPPFLLTRKVPLHNLVTGVALVGGFACCLEARKLALKVAKEEEFEAMKQRAIEADLVDEIGTSTYVSEQQRRQEAERILNGTAERSEAVEHLERSLELDCDDSERLERSEENQLTEEERSILERILQLKAKGYGKAKIIFEIWGVNKGGSAKYKAAESEYERLVNEGENR